MHPCVHPSPSVFLRAPRVSLDVIHLHRLAASSTKPSVFLSSSSSQAVTPLSPWPPRAATQTVQTTNQGWSLPSPRLVHSASSSFSLSSSAPSTAALDAAIHLC